MKPIIKLKFVYDSGGFGPIDIFFRESLTIDTKCISYKKEWEINKRKLDDYSCFEKRQDISWKASIIDDDLVLQIINKIDELALLPFNMSDCDGDSMKVIAHYADGTSQSYSYSYCCYENMRVKYNKLLLKIIPSDLPIPEFLKLYKED